MAAAGAVNELAQNGVIAAVEIGGELGGSAVMVSRPAASWRSRSTRRQPGGCSYCAAISNGTHGDSSDGATKRTS